MEEVPEQSVVAPRKSTVRLLVETSRPKQWMKNAFVLAGMVFSGNTLNPSAEARVWTMVAAFCLASSATYLLNDAVDAEADRLNPRTADRPIARGDLSRTTAVVASLLAGAAALALSFFLSWQSGLVVASYIVLQLGYSLGLKRVAPVDVIGLSLGFVLRALGGLVVIPVPVSDWLLVCTGFLALLLALGKRRGEIANRVPGQAAARASIDGYTPALTDQLVAIAAAAVVVSYAIYAVTASDTRFMGVTIPLVVYGVFRLLQVMDSDGATTEDPSTLLLRDRPLQACVVVWGLMVVALTSV